MRRAIFLAVLTFLLLLIFAAAGEAVQARLGAEPAMERSSAELPPEWVWRRKAISFDDMYRR